jgi:ABC-type branched-subunit amino acid transport system ATPase component/branched-subunit amino acid ABC-type transport system permease component
MEILRFALLGLAIGALYGIAAQGIVLIYRASGVVNFAQGAFVMVGGYVFWELRDHHGLPTAVALIGTLAAGVVLGLLVHYLIMRPMRTFSPIAKVVATLGVLQVLQAVAVLRYGQDLTSVTSMFPTTTVKIDGAVIGKDRIVLFFIGLAITLILWLVYRYTRFGQVTTAVSENERAAASMGHSPDRIAAINWATGSALAAVTGALIGPVTSLQSTQTAQLVLPALAAALLGGFASFPLAFIAALVVGVGQSVMTYEAAAHTWWPGWSQAMPFLLVILYLVLRGRGIPLRSFIFDRLPKVGSGQIRVVPAIVVTVIGIVLVAILPTEWAVALTVTYTFAIVCLSVIVVTGYAGQLSLGQYVIGAMGAFVASKLMADHNTPFALAFVAGVAAAMVIGLIVGAPALRTRGINLAVVTLGIGVSLYSLFLINPELVGSIDGLAIKPASLFGFSLDPGAHPVRYGIAVVVILLLLILMVANLRRGAAGRRLLAVRSNERAALALGVSVYAAKLYAFMLSAGIAAVGVSLLAFINPKVVFGRFDIFSSIGFVTATVVGGLGMLGGSLIGMTLPDGGISSRFLSSISDTLNTYLPLIGGISVLLVLRMGGDGLFEQNRIMGVLIARRLRAKFGRRKPIAETERAAKAATAAKAVAKEQEAASQDAIAEPVPIDRKRRGATGAISDAVRVAPKTLTVRGVTVRFGGVTAVKDMSVTVCPGQVHGLIGPNGAGKTTLIDAVTGFVRTRGGSIDLDGAALDKLGPRRRAARGVARSFQSGELFNDLTVRENLAVGSDSSSMWRYAADLVHPGRIELSQAAEAAAHEFELEELFDLKPDELPFGRRRLVGIARAIASEPSILLLDEPASGLDRAESEELAALIRMMADRWGIGVLLVEHNLDIVLGVCDEVTVMQAGAELLAASPPEVVRTHSGVIAAYVGDTTDEPAAALG